MKNLGFFSTLADRLRKQLGWCPEAPEPKGFLKLVGLPFVYVPVFRVRLVQMGMTIGVLMQVTASALGTIYVAPTFFALIEKFVELEGSLPPEEALSFFFSMIPSIIFLGTIPFMSHIIAGYTVGKTSTKLRYGIIIGVTSSILGSFVSYVIGYFYSPFYGQSFYAMFESLLNLGIVSSPSFYDMVVSGIRNYLFLFALGGGGGAIGQVLGVKFGGKEKE